jgi:hypothetical protein
VSFWTTRAGRTLRDFRLHSAGPSQRCRRESSSVLLVAVKQRVTRIHISHRFIHELRHDFRSQCFTHLSTVTLEEVGS